jgi:hypothetical protein
MPKKNPIKKMTMRQQMRAKAEEQLDAILAEGLAAINKVSMPHTIGGPSLAKLIAGGEQKTHRHMLVTHLANNAEAGLMKLWNDQQNLNLGDDNAKDAD